MGGSLQVISGRARNSQLVSYPSFPFSAYDALRDRSQPAGANPMRKNAKLEITAARRSSA
jgi:hypothetical protein